MPGNVTCREDGIAIQQSSKAGESSPGAVTGVQGGKDTNQGAGTVDQQHNNFAQLVLRSVRDVLGGNHQQLSAVELGAVATQNIDVGGVQVVVERNERVTIQKQADFRDVVEARRLTDAKDGTDRKVTDGIDYEDNTDNRGRELTVEKDSNDAKSAIEKEANDDGKDSYSDKDRNKEEACDCDYYWQCGKNGPDNSKIYLREQNNRDGRDKSPTEDNNGRIGSGRDLNDGKSCENDQHSKLKVEKGSNDAKSAIEKETNGGKDSKSDEDKNKEEVYDKYWQCDKNGQDGSRNLRDENDRAGRDKSPKDAKENNDGRIDSGRDLNDGKSCEHDQHSKLKVEKGSNDAKSAIEKETNGGKNGQDGSRRYLKEENDKAGRDRSPKNVKDGKEDNDGRIGSGRDLNDGKSGENDQHSNEKYIRDAKYGKNDSGVDKKGGKDGRDERNDSKRNVGDEKGNKDSRDRRGK